MFVASVVAASDDIFKRSCLKSSFSLKVILYSVLLAAAEDTVAASVGVTFVPFLGRIKRKMGHNSIILCSITKTAFCISYKIVCVCVSSNKNHLNNSGLV